MQLGAANQKSRRSAMQAAARCKNLTFKVYCHFLFHALTACTARTHNACRDKAVTSLDAGRLCASDILNGKFRCISDGPSPTNAAYQLPGSVSSVLKNEVGVSAHPGDSRVVKPGVAPGTEMSVAFADLAERMDGCAQSARSADTGDRRRGCQAREGPEHVWGMQSRACGPELAHAGVAGGERNERNSGGDDGQAKRGNFSPLLLHLCSAMSGTEKRLAGQATGGTSMPSLPVAAPHHTIPHPTCAGKVSYRILSCLGLRRLRWFVAVRCERLTCACVPRVR
eukprot:1445571-Rhodomonas_salina.2